MAKKPPQKGRKPRKKAPKPAPTCKAILLCERVIVEAGTGNVSLINTFSAFGIFSFPGHTQPFVAFLHLTGANGEYDVTIEVQDLRQDKVIARGEGVKIRFDNRLQRLNVVIPVPPLPVSHAGKYEVIVLANGQIIDRQEFIATEPPKEQNEQPHPNIE